MTQEELADLAHINRTYISKLEKGTTYAGLEIIGKLADTLDVEPTEFLRAQTPATKDRRPGRPRR